MLNKFLGIGNLTRDPELKKFDSGKCVCAFSVAINMNKDDKNPLYIDIQVWDKVATNCNKFLKKGSKVFIEGRLSINSWTSKNGEKRNKIFCKGDVIRFLNTEQKSQDTKPPKDENEYLDSYNSVDEDEDLEGIPF